MIYTSKHAKVESLNVAHLNVPQTYAELILMFPSDLWMLHF